jgi:hypothetical protein
LAFGKDRRAVARHVVAQPALIQPHGRPPVACLVRDITEHGALLEVTDGSYVPKVFALRLLRGDTLISCQIAHVTHGQYGVSFTDQDVAEPAVRRAIRSTAQALRS